MAKRFLRIFMIVTRWPVERVDTGELRDGCRSVGCRRIIPAGAVEPTDLTTVGPGCPAPSGGVDKPHDL